jgi:hypothetical protein
VDKRKCQPTFLSASGNCIFVTQCTYLRVGLEHKDMFLIFHHSIVVGFCAQVRDEIEQLMDDDSDMAELYLTEKKERMALYTVDNVTQFNYSNMGAGVSMSAPVSPVCSPTSTAQSQLQEKTLERMHSLARSRQSHGSSQNEDDRVEELEMLLEAYFVVIDGTLNKLTSVSFCYLSSSDELQFI